jgi:hypothetical protein
MSMPNTPASPGGPGADPGLPVPGDTTQGSGDARSEVADVAKDESRHVAEVAKGEAGNVAATTAEQARNVAGEAKAQAQGVMDETLAQLDEQSRAQRDRLVTTLRSLGDDVERMADQSEGGLAQDLARQVADRAHALSSRLDGREPSELLEEVRSFARRRPGTFLLGALAAGVVAGRLTRGAKDAKDSSRTSSQPGIQPGSQYATPYPHQYGTPGAVPPASGAGGTATGTPTAGVGTPDEPPVYPEGSSPLGGAPGRGGAV